MNWPAGPHSSESEGGSRAAVAAGSSTQVGGGRRNVRLLRLPRGSRGESGGSEQSTNYKESGGDDDRNEEAGGSPAPGFHGGLDGGVGGVPGASSSDGGHQCTSPTGS